MADLSDIKTVDLIKYLISDRQIDKRFYAKVYDDHIRDGVREYNERQIERSQQFRTQRMSDGHLSIVMDPGTDDCICPPGLAGTDLACRAHGESSE